jgi:hypothetical protein
MKSVLGTATAANLLFALLQKVEPGSDLLIGLEGSAYSWTSFRYALCLQFCFGGDSLHSWGKWTKALHDSALEEKLAVRIG